MPSSAHRLRQHRLLLLTPAKQRAFVLLFNQARLIFSTLCSTVVETLETRKTGTLEIELYVRPRTNWSYLP